MIVPLLQIISEAFKVGISSQKVTNEYKKLTDKLSEIYILTEASLDQISKLSNPKIAEEVGLVRKAIS